MNFSKNVLFAALIAVPFCSMICAPDQKSVATKDSCQSFVQEFYGWYVPKAQDVKVDSLDLALKEKRSAFSAKLIKGVEAVEADASRYKEAGPDFDWVLNSQDPGDPGNYSVSDSKVSGYTCRVDVFQRPDGKGERISPELRFKHGRWFFVNFYYPDSSYPQSENLLSMVAA
jgi:hypothetical protein